MHGSVEDIREHNPGKWILILLDEPESETGELLVAHEDPVLIDKELRYYSDSADGLYLTYSIPETERFPSYVL